MVATDPKMHSINEELKTSTLTKREGGFTFSVTYVADHPTKDIYRPLPRSEINSSPPNKTLTASGRYKPKKSYTLLLP